MPTGLCQTEALASSDAIHYQVCVDKHRNIKAEAESTLHRGGEAVTEFISYYTLKCDPVMTSQKFNQALDSVLLKLNQCPYSCKISKLNMVVLVGERAEDAA